MLTAVMVTTRIVLALSVVVSSRINKTNKIEAIPLGPNHPKNKVVGQFTLLPIKDRATGTTRITVRLRMA